MITILFVTVEYFIRRNYGLAQFSHNAYGSDAFIARSSAVRDNVDSIPLLGIVLGSLLGLAAAWLFTVVVTFYERKYHLNE